MRVGTVGARVCCGGLMLLLGAMALWACGDDSPKSGPSAVPDHGPCSGYFSVKLNLMGTDVSPSEITAIAVGGINAIDIEVVDEGGVPVVVGAVGESAA